jgi:hypothetical protein
MQKVRKNFGLHNRAREGLTTRALQNLKIIGICIECFQKKQEIRVLSSEQFVLKAYLSLASLFSACTKNLIPHSDYSLAVIALSMGSAKKKPMTKKEREEKRKKHKEKRLKK